MDKIYEQRAVLYAGLNHTQYDNGHVGAKFKKDNEITWLKYHQHVQPNLNRLFPSTLFLESVEAAVRHSG